MKELSEPYPAEKLSAGIADTQRTLRPKLQNIGEARAHCTVSEDIAKKLNALHLQDPQLARFLCQTIVQTTARPGDHDSCIFKIKEGTAMFDGFGLLNDILDVAGVRRIAYIENNKGVITGFTPYTSNYVSSKGRKWNALPPPAKAKDSDPVTDINPDLPPDSAPPNGEALVSRAEEMTCGKMARRYSSEHLCQAITELLRDPEMDFAQIAEWMRRHGGQPALPASFWEEFYRQALAARRTKPWYKNWRYWCGMD